MSNALYGGSYVRSSQGVTAVITIGTDDESEALGQLAGRNKEGRGMSHLPDELERQANCKIYVPDLEHWGRRRIAGDTPLNPVMRN